MGGCQSLEIDADATPEPAQTSAENDAGGRADAPEVRLDPEAAPEHDGSYRGIYKGVLTTADDSGMFRLDVRNDDPDSIRLRGVFRGTPFSLEGTETHVPQENQYRYRFAGTLGEQEGQGDQDVSLSFRTRISVAGKIDRRNTSFRVRGKPVHVNIVKESSAELARVYEGTYSGSAGGNWNFVLKGERVSGYYTGGESQQGEFEGVLDGDTGQLRVWGESGALLARGSVTMAEAQEEAAERQTNAEGTWLYREASEYSSRTPLEQYPAPGETDNRWQGDRTL
jgi:hypothetical protein